MGWAGVGKTGDRPLSHVSRICAAFSGLIDEVRIYNRALTLTEIQTNMTTPVASSPPVEAASEP